MTDAVVCRRIAFYSRWRLDEARLLCERGDHGAFDAALPNVAIDVIDGSIKYGAMLVPSIA